MLTYCEENFLEKHTPKYLEMRINKCMRNYQLHLKKHNSFLEIPDDLFERRLFFVRHPWLSAMLADIPCGETQEVEMQFYTLQLLVERNNLVECEFIKWRAQEMRSDVCYVDREVVKHKASSLGRALDLVSNRKEKISELRDMTGNLPVLQDPRVFSFFELVRRSGCPFFVLPIPDMSIVERHIGDSPITSQPFLFPRFRFDAKMFDSKGTYVAKNTALASNHRQAIVGVLYPDGRFYARRQEYLAPLCTAMARLQVNPWQFAIDMGMKTGKCCFCGKALSSSPVGIPGIDAICRTKLWTITTAAAPDVWEPDNKPLAP